MESGGSFLRHLLTDDIRCPCREFGLHFCLGEIPAVTVIPADHVAAFFLFGDPCVQFFLGAEAVVSGTVFNKLLRVFEIASHALALNIRTVISSDIGALIPVQTAVFQRVVDHVDSAFDQTSLVGVLDTKNKIAVILFGDQIGVQSRAKVSDMHVSCRARCKSGTGISHFDTSFSVNDKTIVRALGGFVN